MGVCVHLCFCVCVREYSRSIFFHTFLFGSVCMIVNVCVCICVLHVKIVVPFFYVFVLECLYDLLCLFVLALNTCMPGPG